PLEDREVGLPFNVSLEQIVGFSVALIIMSIGLAGSILPGLPSTPLVLFAAIVHRLYFGQNGASIWVLVFLGVLTIFSLVMDYLASMVGAKKLGASRWGIFGAMLGGLIGVFFGLPGLLIGPFVGALALELMGRRTFRESAKAGAGATLGLVAG